MKPLILRLGLITLLAQPALAVTWTGFSTNLPGTSASLRPELQGTLIADQTFTFSSDPSGQGPSIQLDNLVIREFNTGTLDFYFRYFNPNNFAITLSQTAYTGFDLGPALDVDMRTDLIGTFQPSFASRFPGGGSVPDQLVVGSLAHGTGLWTLQAHESLGTILIHTSATDFVADGDVLIIPTTVVTTAFVPVPTSGSGGGGGGSGPGPGPVPEPSSLLLLPLALSALAIKFRRHLNA